MPEPTDEGLHDLERQYLERQAATNEVLRVIATSAFDLDATLQTVVETATRLSHSDHGAIYIADGGVFRIAASVGYDELVEYEGGRPFTPGRDTMVGRVALTGQVAHLPDVLADPEYGLLDVQRAFGFRTLLGVPIKRDGRIIGVVGSARNEVRPFTEAEILLLTSFAEQVAIAIENARLLETIEHQRRELASYLSPQVAALIANPDGAQLLAGHRRRITVVFCDLRGFTSFSETAEPEEVLGVLRAYHAALGELILAHGGTLEHFAGDGVMVFFNDPALQEDHELRAVEMAVAMRERVATLAVGWRKLGYELGFGVGIVAGYATLGRIGFEGRWDYGAVGNAVNLASRLSAEAAPGQILLDQRTYAAVEDRVETRPVGEIALKGFTRPVSAYDVVAIR